MKRLFPVLVIFLLAACAAPTTPTPVISTQEKSSPTPAPTATATPTPEPSPTPKPAIDIQSAFGVDAKYAQELEKQGIADSVEVGENGEMTLNRVIVGFDEEGKPIVEENVKVEAGSLSSYDYNHGKDYGRGVTVKDSEGNIMFWSAKDSAYVRALNMEGTAYDSTRFPFDRADLVAQSAFADPEIDKTFTQEAIDNYQGYIFVTKVDENNGTGFDYVDADGNKVHMDKGSILQTLEPRGSALTTQYVVREGKDGKQHLRFFETTAPNGDYNRFVLTKWLVKDEQGQDNVAFAIASEGEWWPAQGEDERGDNFIIKLDEEDANNRAVPGIIIAQQGGYNEFNPLGGVFVAQPSLDRLAEGQVEGIKDLMTYQKQEDGSYVDYSIEETSNTGILRVLKLFEDSDGKKNSYALRVDTLDLAILNRPYGLFSIASSTIK